MEPIRFESWALDGAHCSLRIAQELPERFNVVGVVVRNEDKARAFTAEWGVPTFPTIDELAAQKPEFVVVSVPWKAQPAVTRELAALGAPILSETPPAPDLAGLIELWNDLGGKAKIQVAEQYHLMPIHAARQAVIDSGVLGPISQVRVAIAHGYHGVSVMRRHLGIQFEDCKIDARKFFLPVVAGSGRSGPPAEERIVKDGLTLATLDFGDKLGVFDFSGEMYFSWIRTRHVMVRGDCGEISDTTVNRLLDHQTPISYELERRDTGHDGNLEDVYHRGISAGSEWVYKNPVAPARLSDDEIAIATCLIKMRDYAAGGPDFYSLAEASQDHYIGMMIDKAAATGETVKTEPQVWG